MKTIVIDDDSSTLPFIQRVLKENCDQDIQAGATSLSVGKALIEQIQPDLIFLDINLPDGKGYDLIRPESRFKVIFITAHNDYAVKAFELAALDYLLKPLAPLRIVEAFKRAKSSGSWNEKYSVFSKNHDKHDVEDRMVIRTTDGFDFLKISNIVFCESDGNYTKIHLQQGKVITTSKTLRSISALLDEKGFFRCHQSYLISLKYIEALRSVRSEIELRNGRVVALARSKKREFLELIESFQKG